MSVHGPADLRRIAFQALAIDPPALLGLTDAHYESKAGIAMVRLQAGGIAWNYAACMTTFGGIRPILKRAADFFDASQEGFSIVVSREHRLLIRSLRRSGWYLCEADSAWILQDMQRIADRAVVSPSWRIRGVDGLQDLPLWIEVLGNNFGRDAVIPLDARPSRAVDEGLRLFLAEEEGRAIGGCAMRARGDVAVVSALSVAASHRGYGIGSALARTAIQTARQAGCGFVALVSAPDAIGFYLRLGFQTAGSLYRYAPPLRLRDLTAIGNRHKRNSGGMRNGRG